MVARLPTRPAIATTIPLTTPGNRTGKISPTCQANKKGKNCHSFGCHNFFINVWQKYLPPIFCHRKFYWWLWQKFLKEKYCHNQEEICAVGK